MEQHSTAGFSLAELLTVLLMVFIVTAILLPILFLGQQRANDATCLSNLRQMSNSIQMYVSDYDDHYPPAVIATFTNNHAQSAQTWRDLMSPYVKKIFPVCPLVSSTTNMAQNERSIDYTGYAYNEHLNQRVHLASSDWYTGQDDILLNYPALAVVLFDARAGILALRGPDLAISKNELYGIWRMDDTNDILEQEAGALRHHGGANYSFADGHVKWLMPGQLHIGKQSDGMNPGFGL